MSAAEVKFERLKLPRTNEKSSFEELFNFKLDPESAQKLHDCRAKVPIYLEPFERLDFESEGKDE